MERCGKPKQRWSGYSWRILLENLTRGDIVDPSTILFPLFITKGAENDQIQAPGQSGGGPFYNPNLTSSQEFLEALLQKYRINLSEDFGTLWQMPWYYPGGCAQKKRTICRSINLLRSWEDAIQCGILRIVSRREGKWRNCKFTAMLFSMIFIGPRSLDRSDLIR